MSKEDIDKKAWRQAIASIGERLAHVEKNLQNVHTPFDLCYNMVEKLKGYLGNFGDKEFCVFNLEFIEVLCYDFGVAKEKIWFMTDCKEKTAIAKSSRYNGVNVMQEDFFEMLKKKEEKKFDVVLGNPPYQAPSKNNNKGAGNTLWDKFVEKSFGIVKENEFVVLIHPSGWRNVGGRFSSVNKILKSHQLKYLEIHNADDGVKTFGAGTRYDWYVAQNKPPTELTVIKGEDGIVVEINIANEEFIPNGKAKEIIGLFAKNPNNRVKFLYDCSYHCTTGPISKTKTDKFIYPCIQHVSAKDGKPSCVYYSSTKELGHFGIPKIIFGRQISGVFLDIDGEYGMGDCCAAIIDDPKNFNFIKKVMISEKFIRLMKMCDVGGNRDRYNRKVISLLKRDFWKEFV